MPLRYVYLYLDEDYGSEELYRVYTGRELKFSRRRQWVFHGAQGRPCFAARNYCGAWVDELEYDPQSLLDLARVLVNDYGTRSIVVYDEAWTEHVSEEDRRAIVQLVPSVYVVQESFCGPKDKKRLQTLRRRAHGMYRARRGKCHPEESAGSPKRAAKKRKRGHNKD